MYLRNYHSLFDSATSHGGRNGNGNVLVYSGLSVLTATLMSLQANERQSDCLPVSSLEQAKALHYVDKAFRPTSRVDVVLGAQWGDEGKGKLVDIMAADYDYCARVAGGKDNNYSMVLIISTVTKIHAAIMFQVLMQVIRSSLRYSECAHMMYKLIL